jgi:hypothetical protein
MSRLVSFLLFLPLLGCLGVHLGEDHLCEPAPLIFNGFHLRGSLATTLQSVDLCRDERSGFDQVPHFIMGDRLPPFWLKWPQQRWRCLVSRVAAVDHVCLGSGLQLLVSMLVVVLWRPALDLNLPLPLSRNQFNAVHLLPPHGPSVVNRAQPAIGQATPDSLRQQIFKPASVTHLAVIEPPRFFVRVPLDVECGIGRRRSLLRAFLDRPVIFQQENEAISFGNVLVNVNRNLIDPSNVIKFINESNLWRHWFVDSVQPKRFTIKASDLLNLQWVE